MSERRLVAWLVLAAALLGAGCRHDMDDLETYIAEVRSRGPGMAEGLPKLRLPAPDSTWGSIFSRLSRISAAEKGREVEGSERPASRYSEVRAS